MATTHVEPLLKSRFRGVYRCGKRWKAQLQNQGVQYYLGTYDTEEEAAKAYDRKAREEKGGRSQTNFDDNGFEVGINHMIMFANSQLMPRIIQPEPPLTAFQPHIGEFHSFCTPFGPEMTPLVSPVRFLWDRLCVISERLLLATAAQDKLSQLQSQQPDDQKQSMIAALSNEITLLTVVKVQIEEAVSRCFSSDLFSKPDQQQSDNAPNVSTVATQLPLIPHAKIPFQLDFNCALGLNSSSSSGSCVCRSCDGMVSSSIPSSLGPPVSSLQSSSQFKS